MTAHDISLKRNLIEQANNLVKTNDTAAAWYQVELLLGTMGDLLSAWSGQAVRLQIVADGKAKE